MLPDVQSYLASRGVEVKRSTSSGEIVCRCPWCEGGSQDTLKVRGDDGRFHCHRCQSKGGFVRLKELLGDMSAVRRFFSPARKESAPIPKPSAALEARLQEAERDLWAGGLGLDYLRGRGFSDETIRRFRFGYYPTYRFPGGECAEPALVIPFLQGGKPALLKMRNLTPADTKKLVARDPSGSFHPLWNVDALAESTGGMVFVTEGELDAASLEQMGFTPAVSGDGGADTFDDGWRDLLLDFDTVAVVYDNDDAGARGFEKVARALGAYRVQRVKLPGVKDANQALREGVPVSAVRDAIDAAESPMRETVVTYDEALRSASDESAKRVLSGVGFTEWNKCLGGLRPAEVSVVCGEPGCGKTTLLGDLARRQVVNGHAVLFGSFENRPEEIAADIEVARRANSDADAALASLRRDLKFIRANGKMRVEQLRDVVLYAVRRFGVQIVVLDNLHAFLPYDATSERFEIDKAVDVIDGLAKQYGLHIFLVVHLRKRAQGMAKGDRDVNDLLGSIGPGRVASNVFHLRVTDAEKCRARLTFIKARSKAARQGAKIALYYDPTTRTFTDGPVKSDDDEQAPKSRFRDYRRAAAGERHDD